MVKPYRIISIIDPLLSLNPELPNHYNPMYKYREPESMNSYLEDLKTNYNQLTGFCLHTGFILDKVPFYSLHSVLLPLEWPIMMLFKW